MPIHTVAIDCTEDYRNQLEKMISTKLKALKTEHQPTQDQWVETVRSINILADNLVIEGYALQHAEKCFQGIWDAMAGKENAVRDAAIKLLDRYGMKHDTGADDPVAVYLQGPMKKSLQEIEKCHDARTKAEKILWKTIDDLPAAWRQADDDSTIGPPDLPEVWVLGPLATTDEAESDVLDVEVRAESADAGEATPAPTPPPMDAQVGVVGSVPAESTFSDTSQAL